MERRHTTPLVLATALLVVLACAVPIRASIAGVKHKTLVLLADELQRNTHSKFLSGLQALGAELDVKLGSDTGLQLRDWDAWRYGNVIVLDPSATDFGGVVDAAALLEFVDAGGGLALALDSKASDQLRDLASELGVDVEPAGSAVIDHFAHNPDDAAHTTVLATGAISNAAVFGAERPTAPIVFKGIGLSVSPESTLSLVALTASPGAYSAALGSPLKGNPDLAGSWLGLTALAQTRTEGRAAIFGSVFMLSDAAFATPVPTSSGAVKSGNEAFATGVAKWLLQQRGVLRVGEFVHYKAGSSQQPDSYRIKDQAEFSVDIQELVDDVWQPYRARDVQLEFQMLDPYVRVNLSHDNKGRFSTSFQVPDVYGVFKFVIEHKRPGYNHIERFKQIAVRPFKHDEYDRYLPPAYPYYTAAATTMLAFAVLSLVFLYS